MFSQIGNLMHDVKKDWAAAEKAWRQALKVRK